MKIVFIILTCLEAYSCCQPYVIESLCNPVGKPSPCPCSTVVNHTDTVVCCNINSLFKYRQGLTCGVKVNTTKHLHFFNFTLHNFNASSEQWKNLESLSVTESGVSEIIGEFRGNLKCVNFSGNSLASIGNATFRNLPYLTTLDISRNKLFGLPELPSLDHRNLTLDISGNHFLICKNVVHLINMKTFKNLHIDRMDETNCSRSRQSFHWFNSTESISLYQLFKRRSVEEECPSGHNYQCNCSFYGMDLVPGQVPAYSVQVDCSGRQLTELPKQLPPNTIVLDVSNNNISSLDELINESTYSSIRELFADNNKIESVKSLEGSHFMYAFRIFSLRRNKLKSIPIYLFSNVFDSRWDAKHVNLAENKLNCDCNTAQIVKDWLQTNSDSIRDADQILCDKEGLGPVITLDSNLVCIYQKDWTEYIYYIIAGEILLLALLVSKVSYDYWIFKTSGYLPWPASKMPKLPCDWVFE